jgi:pimeloyl-ACP methyl ester carboxylesterase
MAGMDDDIEISGPEGPIGAIDWGGAGDPLLLVHGGGTNAAQWAPVVPYLDDYRCVSFDLPGHGRTPAPAASFYDLWLEVMDAVIAHFALPRERLAIVGGSFGGSLAVWYDGQRPGHRAVVGIDSAPWMGHVNGTFHGREARTAESFRADGWGWSGDQAGYEANVAQMVAGGCPEPCARRKHLARPDGTYVEVPTPEFLECYHNVGSDPENPLVDPAIYGGLHCPTLMICGNDGMAAHNREYVDAMPDRFPMVSVTWVDGGHELDWERPELTAELTKRFLAGQL